MSTNALISFLEVDEGGLIPDESFTLYVHCDGYPTGIVSMIQKAISFTGDKKDAFSLASSFIAANRRRNDGGNIRVFPQEKPFDKMLTIAIEWHYEIYRENHEYFIDVHALRLKEPTVNWSGRFSDLILAASSIEGMANDNAETHNEDNRTAGPGEERPAKKPYKWVGILG
jgi:hypothetical protein